LTKDDFDFSEHALKRLMLRREIELEWVMRCLDHPDRLVKLRPDRWYYLRRIPEFGNRVLKIVVNPLANPPKVITMHFDRDLSGES